MLGESFPGWPYIGAAGVAHIEASAAALLRAFSLTLEVITGRVAFGLPENS